MTKAYNYDKICLGRVFSMRGMYCMKKVLLSIVLSLFFLPAFSADVEVPSVQSVKYFSQPQDSRFQYDLPAAKDFLKFKKDSKQDIENEDAEVTLDAEDIKPAKKIIKKLGDNPEPKEQTLNQQDLPMNYDSFPKYYDANDMMQQQFMPMF